jgi:hypothetical protein
MNARARVRLDRVDNDARQALSRASAGPTLARALQYAFVFRPGGVAGGQVYTTWPTLMAAVNGVQGPKLVQIDTTFGVANVPPGMWNLNSVSLTGTNGIDFEPVLHFLQDAHVTFDVLHLEQLRLMPLGTTPVCSANLGATLLLDDGAQLLVTSAGVAPFWDIAVADTFLICRASSQLGQGAFPVISVEAGETLFAQFDSQAFVHANAFGGAGSLSGSATSDVTFNLPQTVATLNLSFASIASQTAYPPAVLANWSGVAPTSVANALDRIAAKITPIP